MEVICRAGENETIKTVGKKEARKSKKKKRTGRRRRWEGNEKKYIGGK